MLQFSVLVYDFFTLSKPPKGGKVA